MRIEPSGVKTYFIRYRANGGGRTAPQKLMTIGRHGQLTPDEARKRARVLLGSVAAGQDPAGERSTRRKELTVRQLIDLYAEEGCFIQRGRLQGQPMKDRTKAYTLARLRHHVIPLLGSKRVDEIGAGEIERFVRDVTAGRTAKDIKQGRARIVVRGGEGAARKTVRDLSAVFSFARRRSIVSENPVDRAAIRKTDNRRDRFLSLEEIERLGRAFSELEAEGINPKALNIARLWALTGCRRDEIATLRWSEVDLQAGFLRLADSKTGRSVRPLGTAARVLLASVKNTGQGFVFPADGTPDRPYQGTKRIWPKIVARADLPGITPHTLRHTLGSVASSSGEAILLTGAILGHANARSTALYAHVDKDPARLAADRVSERIEAALRKGHEIRQGVS
ncbi:tyrosine-type recombinase/integrase [Terrihabitans sp. B22-R8]|uniref:tyrosine-type recombinase/integrase n=1 Tax=Terrihabitans sp. B22-R8 TaxID=3425128 RepID=UPI00403D1113